MAHEQRPLPAGALGARLAGRLTAELIARSKQYMSCIGMYEIDMRGNKIAAIENLGATQDLAPLSTLPKLRMLSLLGNPVTTKPNYRLYVISKCKALKVLDFKKVKQKEREEAAKKFPTDESAAAEASRTFEPEEDLAAAQAQAGTSTAAAAAAGGDAEMSDAAGSKPRGLTPEQQLAVKAAIANAATLEEIQRLEAALTTGQLPSEVAVDGAAADGGGKAGQAGAAGAADTNGHADGQPDAMVVG